MNFKRITAIILTCALLASSSIISFADTTTTEASGFTDIDNSWALTNIMWGVNNGVIKGYSDGTFRPLANVTRVEFLSMMMRMCENVDKTKIGVNTAGGHWGQNIYNEALNTYKLPINWLSDAEKNKPITRGEVAILVAAKHRFQVGQSDAVQYMYDNTLSYGKVEGVKTYANYGVPDNLTREQAAAFLNRIFEVDFTSYKGKESDTTGNIMGGLVNPISFIQAGLFEWNGKPVAIDPATLVKHPDGGVLPPRNGQSGSYYSVGNPAWMDVSMDNTSNDIALGNMEFYKSKATDAQINAVCMVVEQTFDKSTANKVESLIKAGKGVEQYITNDKGSVWVKVSTLYDTVTVSMLNQKF